MLDRFYPPRPYGLGKPQAHWLLDEAGAILVAAALGLERKRLGWQRRDDWASHPQLLHRLEANRFVTDLIAATLKDRSLGVSEWWGSRSAASRLTDASQHSRPIPDAGFFIETSAGPIECYLEWDRGTETLARLTHKLTLYRHAEVHSGERRPVNVLFVVPTARRQQALVAAVTADAERRRKARDNWFTPSWPLSAALTAEISEQGALARVWRSLAEPTRRARLSELTAQTELKSIELARCLGRRWHKEQPDFWQTLSPLGVPATRAAPEPGEPSVPVIEGPRLVERMREQLLAEARRDAQEATVGSFGRDWTSSGIDGLMLDPDEEPGPEEWR